MKTGAFVTLRLALDARRIKQLVYTLINEPLVFGVIEAWLKNLSGCSASE